MALSVDQTIEVLKSLHRPAVIRRVASGDHEAQQWLDALLLLPQALENVQAVSAKTPLLQAKNADEERTFQDLQRRRVGVAAEVAALEVTKAKLTSEVAALEARAFHAEKRTATAEVRLQSLNGEVEKLKAMLV